MPLFYIIKKTDVGMYDIMFGRGWLCIIERGWLFDIHGLYGGCVGLYHYYNGNLRATYTYIMITIWTYSIYLCAYRVTHFYLFPVNFCIQMFHYVQVNSYFSQFNNVFEIILVFWKKIILITCLAVHSYFPWRLAFPNSISTNIILYVTTIMIFP